jgi:hypothetical protein
MLSNVYIDKIMALLDNQKIRVWVDAWDDDCDDSAKCEIGEHWFYFLHIEEDECLEDYSTDEIAHTIYNVIDNGVDNGLSTEEADYYVCVIDELFEELPLETQKEYVK